MRRTTLFALGLLLAALASAPSAAAACWDGFSVRTPHLTMAGGDDQWRPERARRIAKWAPRVEALLATAGVTAEVYWGQVVLSDGTRLGIRHDRLDRLFVELARHLRVMPEARRRALAAPRGLTVQVAASRDRGRAEALAARLNDRDHLDGPAGAHGAYEAGGFPATNDTVHVITEPDARDRPVHRVIVGVFLDRERAEEVAREVSARSGTRAFARPL